jgi:tripartite-type tricarboxylate transporter receptor subunit TctC
MRPRRTLLHLVAAASATVMSVVAATFPSQEARGQTTRTIKIVVPLPAGGTADILARILGEQIGRAQGLTVLIENRPGAGAVIGTEAVSRAAPDGNTLLVAAPAFVISPHLRKLNYDPLTSFEPICYLTSTPTVLLVNGASPYRTLGDLLDAARANPGSLTLATVPGSPPHLAFEMLKRAANVDMTSVPYPGGAPAVSALLGNHVTSAFLPYAGLEEQLKAGKLRSLASGSRTRSELLPDVPTIAESGYKGYEIEFWNGVLAPAKTPQETVSQLAGWFTAAMQVPDVKAKLIAQSLYPVGMCGDDFGALLRKQHDEFGRVIREANIKAD